MVIEERGIMLQSRGSEDFPGSVWAQEKVKDKHSSFGQPYIKGKTRSPGKGSGLRRLYSSRRPVEEKIKSSGNVILRNQESDGKSLRSKEAVKR